MKTQGHCSHYSIIPAYSSSMAIGAVVLYLSLSLSILLPFTHSFFLPFFPIFKVALALFDFLLPLYLVPLRGKSPWHHAIQ